MSTKDPEWIKLILILQNFVLFAGISLKWKTLSFFIFLCKPYIWENSASQIMG